MNTIQSRDSQWLQTLCPPSIYFWLIRHLWRTTLCYFVHIWTPHYTLFTQIYNAIWRHRDLKSDLNNFIAMKICRRFHHSAVTHAKFRSENINLHLRRRYLTRSCDAAYYRAFNTLTHPILGIGLKIYRRTSNVSRISIGNKIVDHSDAVGASPVGAAPTIIITLEV